MYFCRTAGTHSLFSWSWAWYRPPCGTIVDTYSFLSKAPAAPDVVASFLLQRFFDMSRCREMYSGRFCGWLLGRRHCQSVVFQEQAALAIRESSKSSLSSMRFVAPPIFSFPAYSPQSRASWKSRGSFCLDCGDWGSWLCKNGHLHNRWPQCVSQPRNPYGGLRAR